MRTQWNNKATKFSGRGAGVEIGSVQTPWVSIVQYGYRLCELFTQLPHIPGKDKQYLSPSEKGLLTDPFCTNICSDEQLHAGALYTGEWFFPPNLLVLQGACFISSFLVHVMNFQLSEPLRTCISHWRARSIVFKIAGEVNNSEQCWTLLPSPMLYR